VETVVQGYLHCIENQDITGQVFEASVDKIHVVPRLAYVDGKHSERAALLWDPYFKQVHGELSGLPNVLRKQEV
jgi:hypothetical protein